MFPFVKDNNRRIVKERERVYILHKIWVGLGG